MSGAPSALQVSVIIPCRNEATLLPRQLRALADQDFPGSWEILMVDNGSTDATVAVARAAAPERVELVVVDAAHPAGRHHACNAGARVARGEVLLFIDADDAVQPGYVRAMAAGLARWPIVGASIDHRSLSTGWVLEATSDAQTHELQEGHGFMSFASGGALGIRTAVYRELDGFRPDYKYAEDIDLCWRAQLTGHQIGFVHEAVLRYQYRDDLPSMYRQHRGFGRGAALLFRDYRRLGMPRRSTPEALRQWWRLGRGVLSLSDRGARGRWVRRLGRNVGRLQGSVRFRVWYP